MQKIQVTVECAQDGTFWCYTNEDIQGVGLNGAGNTVAEAKADFMECLAEAKADAQEQGTEFLEVEFEYKYDLRSFFNYFSFLNMTDIAKRTGINPSLLHQYNSGIKTAGEKTYRRLSACLSDIRKDLQSAVF